jgi:nucleotide-binding universal stress UspA family protein
MYRKVLLAYDGSAEGRLALCEAALLAKLCQGDIFLLAVVNPSTGTIMAESAVPGAVQLLGASYQRVLAEGVEWLQVMGFDPTARLEFGDPADQIAAVAGEIGADLVIVGHRRQSTLARWWGGSVGASLLKELQCSLLIAQMNVGEMPALKGAHIGEKPARKKPVATLVRLEDFRT